MTLIGCPIFDCGYTALKCSKNWFVTVGDGTGSVSAVTSNQEVGRYTAGDRFGKEIFVAMMAQSVTVWKNFDYLPMVFRSILLTTTSTDCTGNFDWTGTTLT